MFEDKNLPQQLSKQLNSSFLKLKNSLTKTNLSQACGSTHWQFLPDSGQIGRSRCHHIGNFFLTAVKLAGHIAITLAIPS
jgi:hypothetical protein